MAIDHFLDLKSGQIEGESTDAKFKGHIELESWSIHGTNPPDLTSAKSGAGTGRVSMGYLECTAKHSKATIHLFDRLIQGTHIPTAVLTCRKAGGGQEPFHEITLEEVYVANHHLGGSSGSDWLYDTFSLAFGSIQHKYLEQNEKGGTESSGQKKWDLRTNKATG